MPKAAIHKNDKIRERWEEGVFYGLLLRSSEYIIGTNKGCIKAHAIKRMNEEEAWDQEKSAQVKGTPWEPVPGKPGHKLPTYVHDEGEVVID